MKTPFGLKNNKLIHISELKESEKGLKCNCFCPGCGSPLNARMGKVNVNHFAHSDSNCTYGVETSLHAFAKEVLSNRKEIIIPPMYIEYDYTVQNKNDIKIKNEDINKSIVRRFNIDSIKVMKVSDKEVIKFEDVKVEQRVDNIVPDIIMYKNNRPLLVEIFVSHKVEKSKKEKITNKNISTLEIDLSGIYKNLYSYTVDELENLILYSCDNKKWIYNRTLEEKLDKAMDDINTNAYEYQYNRRQREIAATKTTLTDKYGVCRSCNKNTNNWTIHYGDGTCFCRECRLKEFDR